MKSVEVTPITEILAKALKNKCEAEKLSNRAVGRLTGISSSTISRIRNLKGKQDAEVVIRLCDWLGLPAERVLNHEDDAPVSYLPNSDLPQIVDAHLERDINLTKENAAKLSEIFRTAYRQFGNFESKEKTDEK
jgi:transcriptional regulator with XRE-family HTH domain